MEFLPLNGLVIYSHAKYEHIIINLYKFFFRSSLQPNMKNVVLLLFQRLQSSKTTKFVKGKFGKYLIGATPCLGRILKQISVDNNHFRSYVWNKI